MKLKFKNGAEMPYIHAIETEEYHNGHNRRVMRIECGASAISLDALNGILSNEDNISEIILTGENGTGNIYSGYSLKLNCGIENILITPETPEAAAVYEDRLIFKIGKRTYIEQMLKNLGV